MAKTELNIMQFDVMEKFIFRVKSDGTMDFLHTECLEWMKTPRGGHFQPLDLKEAYEAAENHLLRDCREVKRHPNE